MYSKLVQRSIPPNLVSNMTNHMETGPFSQMASDIGSNHRCFDDCINDFTSKAVSTKEETCISRCVDKFIKASERTGQRFAEQNQAMAQGGGTGIGGR